MSETFEVGSEVAWTVRGNKHSGIVREIVMPGCRPSAYSDSYGVPSAAIKTRYVVEENGKLFYPATSTFHNHTEAEGKSPS